MANPEIDVNELSEQEQEEEKKRVEGRSVETETGDNSPFVEVEE